jgi:hypothetical protein
MIREAGGVQSGAKKARRLKDRLRTLSLSLSLSPLELDSSGAGGFRDST